MGQKKQNQEEEEEEEFKAMKRQETYLVRKLEIISDK